MAKEKKLKEIFDQQKPSLSSFFGSAVDVYHDGNNHYAMPKGMKEDILRFKLPSGKEAKGLNARCSRIQKWLVTINKNINVIKFALRAKGIDNQIKKFITLSKIDMRKMSEFDCECLKHAWEIMPIAWREGKQIN
jgi:hypothetical protein